MTFSAWKVHYTDTERTRTLSLAFVSVESTQWRVECVPPPRAVRKSFNHKYFNFAQSIARKGSTSEIFILCIRHLCHIIYRYIGVVEEASCIFSGSGPDKSLATVLRTTHTYSEVRLLDEQTYKMHQKINQSSDESGRCLSISSFRGAEQDFTSATNFILLD